MRYDSSRPFAEALSPASTPVTGRARGAFPALAACLPSCLNDRALWFGLLLVWVAFVSVHDAMLIVANRGVINEVEENPVGQWLLQCQDGQVWLFVIVKLLATSLVTTFVALLFRARGSLGLAVVTGLALFQAGLFAYLTLF